MLKLRIFQSHRFYVKSSFGILEVPKTAILALNLDFNEFLHFCRAEMYHN